MWMIDTVIGLGIALALVALYLLSCIRVLNEYPMAMQMRYLQALAEVASEKNSTIIFPLPLELLGPFLRKGPDGASAAATTTGRPEDMFLGVKDSAQSEQANGTGATPAAVVGNGR